MTSLHQHPDIIIGHLCRSRSKQNWEGPFAKIVDTKTNEKDRCTQHTSNSVRLYTVL
jgi:hypothetical protein